VCDVLLHTPLAAIAGDIWAVEIELPAGTKVEYKFVILEEQDWTQQVRVFVQLSAHASVAERVSTTQPCACAWS
jgi:hypothetical protein